MKSLKSFVFVACATFSMMLAAPAFAAESVKTTLTYEPTLEVEVKDSGGNIVTDWDFDAHPFTATLETQSGAPMPEITKSVTNSYGVIKWPTVELEQGKTYIYTMRQIEGEAEGVTYDVKPHALTITVNYRGYPTCLWDSLPVSSKYVSIANTYVDPTEPPADEPEKQPDTPTDTDTDTDTLSPDNDVVDEEKTPSTDGTSSSDTVDYTIPAQGITGVLSDTGYTAPALMFLGVAGICLAIVLIRRQQTSE